MNDELKKEFFGDVKFESGKINKKILLKEFCERFNVKELEGSRSTNEYNTEDVTLTNESLTIKVEVSDEYVTHINDFEQI